MSEPDEARRFYARLMAAQARSADPRIEEVFASVPREAFLGPGPWTVFAGEGRFETPSADPGYIYQNVLVVLDADKGINNGEPLLHAMWLGKVEPKPGEAVTHIGAGTGYYTALLSKLVEPGGSVTAFELEADLAARAKANLARYANVEVVQGDAVANPLPPSDIIYVNAGVVAPPAAWLGALKPGGRMIFPWRPSETVGLAVLITRLENGFACRPFMGSWFIPCVGASTVEPSAKIPTRERAARTRSIWLREDKAPDRTATASSAMSGSRHAPFALTTRGRNSRGRVGKRPCRSSLARNPAVRGVDQPKGERLCARSSLPPS